MKTEVESEKYLKSLTPAEELGIFSNLRGACLQSNNRCAEATEAYRNALSAFPQSFELKHSLSQSERNITF